MRTEEKNTEQRQTKVSRIFKGTILASGEVFINARPAAPGKPGKMVVRLFDRNDNIVTRLWNETVNLEVEAEF